MGIENLQENESDFLKAGDVLRDLGQMQYISRPLFPEVYTDVPTDIKEGIRFKGVSHDYHSIKIHKDDILAFAERYIDWKNNTSARMFGGIDKEKALQEIKEKLISI